MFCSTCQQIFQEPAKVDGDKGFSAEHKCDFKFSAICASSESCFSCRMLWQRLRIVKFKNGDNDPTLGLTFTLKSNDSPERKITLKIVARQEPSDKGFWVEAVLEESSQSESRRLHAVKTDSTGSEEALRFVRERLAECEASHPGCRLLTTSSPSWCPTRLVQLTASGPRLIETKNHAMQGPYATLSHRWGGSDILTCTKDTKEDLEAGIGPSFLTQTFRDALHAIEQLGINYIWIGSLCIIQDSTEDWTREALRMGKVYRYAYVNLAATRAENSQAASKTPWVLIGDTGDREIQLAPLNNRGWVMQERLLSPRAVHFAKEQIFWDCAGLTASETLPRGLPLVPGAMWIEKKQFSSLFIQGPEEAERGKDIRRVLIALEGIAEHLRNVLGYEYLAGLWRRQIELQLCWFVARTEPPVTRNHIAPSWSWASVDGLVEMLSGHVYRDGFPKNLLAAVTDAVVEQVQGQRGSIYVGHVKMRCFLNPTGIKKAVHPDHGDNCACLQLTGAGAEYAQRVIVDTSDVIGAEGLFLVPMFDVPSYHLMKRNCQYSEMRAMLLKIVDERTGKFERCGHVMLQSSNFPSGKFPDGRVALTTAEAKAELPCIEYDKETGHLIKIVSTFDLWATHTADLGVGFRVEGDGNNTFRGSLGSMVSRDPLRSVDINTFRDHFDWNCYTGGPFISFFGEWDRALGWRQMLIDNGWQNIVVIAVWLGGRHVWDAHSVARDLGCPNLQQHRNEYLLYGGIAADEYRILAMFHGDHKLEPVKLCVTGSNFEVSLPGDFVGYLCRLPMNSFGITEPQDITEDIMLEVYSHTGDKGGFKLDYLLSSITKTKRRLPH
ncbi:hypothetical protein NUW58_g4286 [Xylaria curta]|uniref:Uncharacterized protein n=1 Tax=Xylaria curta TaxID=42375 RepID=A0ACC1P729_9PEZI|nr:hypothetical protein NUW58_g4286 [Xylaria curta]